MNSNNVLKAVDINGDQVRTLALPASREAPVADRNDSNGSVDAKDLQNLLRRSFEEGRVQGRDEADQSARERADAEAQIRLDEQLKMARDQLIKEYADLSAQKWRSLAAALAAQARALRDELEAEVTEWTFVAAARLLGDGGHLQVPGVVRQVLKEAGVRDPMTVLLHADDLSLVVEDHESSPDRWPAEVTFAADERVSVGGCLLASPAQTIDARFEVQLELLREALDQARRERREAGQR